MNTNNGNRRTSLRLQSKLAKTKSISSNNTNNSSVANSSTTSSIKTDSIKPNENINLNSATKDNLRSAMILRSNLLGSSTQEIKSKLYRLGKITDKKFKLKPRKHVKNTTNTTSSTTATAATNSSNKKRSRKLAIRKREKKLKTWSTVSTSSSRASLAQSNANVQETEIANNSEEVRPTTSASSSSSHSSSSSLLSSPLLVAIESHDTNNVQALPLDAANLTLNPNSLSMNELKFQLKKATVKFNKACRQLTLLDQHMSDLQNSYSNAVDNDRKTFKIVFRMQLATLEGTHNAYIEYIERQVEKIKKLKQLLFTDNSSNTITNQNINNNQPI